MKQENLFIYEKRKTKWHPTLVKYKRYIKQDPIFTQNDIKINQITIFIFFWDFNIILIQFFLSFSISIGDFFIFFFSSGKWQYVLSISLALKETICFRCLWQNHRTKKNEPICGNICKDHHSLTCYVTFICLLFYFFVI